MVILIHTGNFTCDVFIVPLIIVQKIIYCDFFILICILQIGFICLSLYIQDAFFVIILHRKNHPRKPGVTLYFLRALALALAEHPDCAGYMVGGRILTPRRIDLGVAVQVADGVMVPVMRNVNERTLDDLIDEYNKVVGQARDRRLDPAYLGGGIATVSNFGGFGLTHATPMPLPSESLILGVGAVQKVPVWSDEVECFLPVEQAHIVASFDHRVMDGGDIGRLMLRIAYYLEHPEYL